MQNNTKPEELIKQCWDDISKILDKYNCLLDSTIVVTTQGIVKAEILIILQQDDDGENQL